MEYPSLNIIYTHWKTEPNKQLMFTLMTFCLPKFIPQIEDIRLVEKLFPELTSEKIEDLTEWHSHNVTLPKSKIKKGFENLLTLTQLKLEEYKIEQTITS